MRYLSVCSGIESATVAWHPLGWQSVAFSEIEPYPCALLEHHYPDVPNWGDMTKFKEWPDADIDLLVGGTPCQSFSVAGLRKGLDDPRGNLMLTYLAIAGRYRPKWVVWENVPGVLSSNGGKDFGAFLGGLAELGYGFAYRILDAQYYGVAQRRRRVFVVGCAGDWRSAAAVLFERHSLSGHPAPSREAGQGFAADVAPSLRGQSQASHRLDSGAYVAAYQPVAHCLNAGGMGRQDYETESFVIHGTQDPCVGDVAFALGRNSGQENAVAYSVALRGRDGGATAELGDEVGNTLRASGGGGDKPYVLTRGVTIHGTQDPCADVVAFHENQQAQVWESDVMQPLNTGGGKPGQSYPAIRQGMAVRRLTPTECERLQGFPDNYTNIPYRGKPITDGHRYKALGNSKAVPVVRWIGERIAAVERISK